MDKAPKKKKKFLFRYAWIGFVFIVGVVIVKGEEVEALLKGALKKIIDQPILLLTADSEEEYLKRANTKVCENKLTLAFECAEPVSWYRNQENPICGGHKAPGDILPPSIESYGKGDFIYWFGYCNGTSTNITAEYGKDNFIHIDETFNPASDKLDILDCKEEDDEINNNKKGVPQVFAADSRNYAAFGVVARNKRSSDFISDDQKLTQAVKVVWGVTPHIASRKQKRENTTGSNLFKICTRPMYRKK